MSRARLKSATWRLQLVPQRELLRAGPPLRLAKQLCSVLWLLLLPLLRALLFVG